MKIWHSLRALLQKPEPGEILGVFRVVFGVFMLYEIVNYIQIDLVANTFILPSIRLSYPEFAFLPVFSEPVMDLVLYAMLICVLCILFGFLFRPACFIFSILYLYIFLLDKSLFNNHIYLFILFAFLLGFTRADKYLSLGRLFKGRKERVPGIPHWQVFILQLQLAIVYFYGGLAKINPEWLFRQEPMRSMIEAFPPDHVLAPVMKGEFAISFLTYGGLVFDLIVPFLLWSRKFRKWTLIPLVFFHISNAHIFNDIGIFPFIMICSTILFFTAEEIPGLRQYVSTRYVGKVQLLRRHSSPSRWLAGGLVCFFVFQLFFPFRGFALPNHVDWSMLANRFSWRMKIQTRELEEYRYDVVEKATGTGVPVQINQIINTQQILVTFNDPIAAATVGKGIARLAKDQGIDNPEVYARIKVRWNGHPSSYIVDPGRDLSGVEIDPLRPLDWIPSPPGRQGK